MPVHNSLAHSAAGFLIMLAVQSEAALPDVRTHFGEEPGHVIAIHIPQAEFSRAGGVDQPAAKVTGDHLCTGGCMATFTRDLTDLTDLMVVAGQQAVQYAAFTDPTFAQQY